MNHEQDYYYNKLSMESNYIDTLYQKQISSADIELDLKLFQVLKPMLVKEGNQWCCLYGENLQEGIAGFGDTPHQAVLAFNNAWYTEQAKPATL
jgi:hypothetical protein